MAVQLKLNGERVSDLGPQKTLKNHLTFYIQGDFGRRQVTKVMEDHPSGAFVPVQSISLADVIIWTGGADINPKLYYEPNVASHYIDHQRDRADVSAVKIAQDSNAIKIGICRGAQLLNCVVNKGRLWQDVDKHNGSPHICKDYTLGNEVLLNSVHHQMMRMGPEGILVCGTTIATEKFGYEDTWKRTQIRRADQDVIDPEVIWYPKTKSLCFQPHPEYAHSPTKDYFHECISRYILKAGT